MVTAIFSIVVGFVMLVWGAERFVLGASATARNLGVSPLIIGLTIVGFGTSAPEMLVSAVASWHGNPGLAIGNAVGSNITNIGLVLAAAALVVPLKIHSAMLRRELPVLLLIMVLGLTLLLDDELGRGDGMLLLAGMGLMIYWLVKLGLGSRADPMTGEFVAEMPESMTLGRSLAWLGIGMVVMFAGSRVLVNGAVTVAVALGVSDLVIGLTIIAVGTSLPELAAAVLSAIKGEHEIAVGNVIGSNMFNMLGVMAMPGLIAPGRVPDGVLSRDYPLMLLLTMALFVMAYGIRGEGRINRIEACILLGVYIGYIYYILYSTVIKGAVDAA